MKIDPILLNNVALYPFNSEEELFEFIETKGGILVAINAEKILHATDQTRAIINRNIGYSDGIGAVMALRQKGCKDVCRIPGCELWLKIIAKFQDSKSFYLIGAKPSVIESTTKRLQQEFPAINIVGYRDGYIKGEAEREALIEDIVEKKPDVVFVAMGSPKQEILMEEIQRHHTAIYQGLGGSFDIYTGDVERAPLWWRNHNLEFAYRLIRDPRRIIRYRHLVKYAYWLVAKRL